MFGNVHAARQRSAWTRILTVLSALGLCAVVIVAGAVPAAASSTSRGALLDDPAPSISGSPPSGTVGTPYSYAFTVTGDPTPTVDPNGQAVASGGGYLGPCGFAGSRGPSLGLPPGLTLSSAGVLSGTPTTAGQYTFTPEATNTEGTTYGSQVYITIAPATAAAVRVSGGNLQTAAPGTAFTQPLSVTVTDASGHPVVGRTVTFTVTSGAATFPSLTPPSCTAPTATATTNSSGIATSPTLTAGATAGLVTVTATTTNADGSTVGTTFIELVAPSSSSRADLAISLSVPATLNRGATAIVTVTVTNNGPSAASDVAAAVYIPPSLTVTNAGGGTTYWGLTVFTTPTVAAGAKTTFTLTVHAGSTAGRSILGALTGSLTIDPNLYNNVTVAVTTVK